MKVTAQEEYGLRCLIQVAAAGPERPLTVHEIAEREGLSGAYVAKLMNQLRDAGLVDSVRGRSGGYFIARPADTVSISEILASFGRHGGHLFEAAHDCDRFPGDADSCVHMGDCSIRSLWGSLEGLVDRVLRQITLADLMKSERRMAADLLTIQKHPAMGAAHARPFPLMGLPVEAPGETEKG